MRPTPPVFLVGAGPGDPGLITVRGREALRSANVVVHDHLVSPRLLALAPAGAERIFAGKKARVSAMPQAEINALLIDRARQGKRVVRLKGGDPFVFGRGAEEAEALRAAGVPFRVVPGVTAAVGVSAYAGIPLTHRDVSSNVVLVTGHDDPDSPDSRVDWNALAKAGGTLVVYMGVTQLPRIVESLLRAGRAGDETAALIEWASTARQRTVEGTLSELPRLAIEANARPPTLIIVGDVVQYREKTAWFEALPLFGQRVVLTRPLEESERSALALEEIGAEVILAPTVEIHPLDDFTELDRAITNISTYEWIVFTSGNGVRHFLDRLQRRGKDLRSLGNARIAAIGPATADALASFRLAADIVPLEFRSEGLVDALRERVAGRSVLLVRADRGRPVLRDELERVARVDQVAAYRNVDVASLPAVALEQLDAGLVQWITLTSSAITERLFQLLPAAIRTRVGASIRLASLSPITTATANRLGWNVAVEAEQATWASLVEGIVAAVESQ